MNEARNQRSRDELQGISVPADQILPKFIETVESRASRIEADMLPETHEIALPID